MKPAATTSELHHGTSIRCLLGILAEGAMRDDLGDDGHGQGVSFTTDVEIAWKFALDAEEFVTWSVQLPPGSSGEGAVMTLGHAFLTRIGLRELRWDGVQTEREHRTPGPVANVLEGVERITFRVEDLARIKDNELAESDAELDVLTAMERLVEGKAGRVSLAGETLRKAIAEHGACSTPCPN